MFAVGTHLHRQIFLALALVTLLSVLLIGFTAYLAQRTAIKRQFSAKLMSTADLKEFQIASWLTERKSDVALLAQNHLTEQQLGILLSPTATQQEQDEAALHLHALLTSMKSTQEAYSRVLIVEPEGTILVSADEALVGTRIPDRSVLREILEGRTNAVAPPELVLGQDLMLGQVYVQSIGYNSVTDAYEMCFGHLIQAPNSIDGQSARTLGILIITVDMDLSIYPMLSEWHMGETGAAVLTRAEANGIRVLNQVRYDTAAPLERLLPFVADAVALPAQLSAQGKEGTRIITDHLGHEVVAVYRHIPEINWGLVLKMDTSEIFIPLRRLVHQVLIITLGVLLCSLLLSLVIAETLTIPIQRLVSATRAVAQGNLAVTVATDRQDEIGMLARSFSNMVTSIDQYQRQLKDANLENACLVQKLQDWNLQLEAKVAERTQELERANAQLMSLDEMKTEFLYTVSHELRNPITNLKLQLDLLRRNGESPRRSRYIEAISKQIDLMGQLIDDMLDLIQLEKMGNQILFNPLDLNEVVADVLVKFQYQLVERNIGCAVHYADQSLLVSGEQIQIRRAITHLLRNAINFTSVGTVTVRTFRHESRACVEVTDTGIGIASNELPYIFQRFYRGTNVSQSTIPGSGLGLSLAREVAALHQGELEVESQLNQGSTFRIWFPALEPSHVRAVLVG